jgi:hypothetical protein
MATNATGGHRDPRSSSAPWQDWITAVRAALNRAREAVAESRNTRHAVGLRRALRERLRSRNRPPPNE